MKKTILLTLIVLNACINHAYSQNSIMDQSIDSINTLLKANPYHDGFNDVTFNNSVRITEANELVIEMSFDGPFKWIYSVNIRELDLTPRNDACKESPSSLCWVCAQKEDGQQTSCIRAEMVFSDGSTETQQSSNICVSFSPRAMICNDLYLRVQRLFSSILNQDM